MTHLLQSLGWAELDLDPVAGRVVCQQRWKYRWLIVASGRDWTFHEQRVFVREIEARVWGSWSNRILLRTSGAGEFATLHPTIEIEFDIRATLAREHWNVDVRRMLPGSNPATFVRDVEPGQRRIRLDTPDLAPFHPRFELRERGPNPLDLDSVEEVGRLVRERQVQMLIEQLRRMVPDCDFSFRGPAVQRSSRATKGKGGSPLPSNTAPQSIPPPPPSDESKSWFELTLVDEVGEPIDGIDINFNVAGQKRKVTTNGAGTARASDVAGSFGSAQVISVAAVREKLEPRWDKGVREGKPPTGPRVRTVPLAALGSMSLECETPTTVVIVRSAYRARLIGFYFDTAKSFILPNAMVGIRGIKRLYDRHPEASMLVVGHTDAAGKPDYNDKLSLERARAVVAQLTNDVDAWTAWFGDDKPSEKRWGTLEVQYMLATLPEGGEPFYAEGTPSGVKDPKTRTAVKKFQAWNNETHGTTLDVDGNAGKDTRAALVKAYMELEDTTLPEGIAISAHGAGESFPEDPTPDGVADPDNRRVEIFVFDDGVHPPAPSDNLPPGSPEYSAWRAQVVDTMDVEHQGCRVRVVDEFGNIVPHAKVTLEGPHQDDEVADEAGLVTFFNLSNGMYTVRAEKDGYVFGETTFTYPPDPLPDPSKPMPLLEGDKKAKSAFFHDDDGVMEI